MVGDTGGRAAHGLSGVTEVRPHDIPFDGVAIRGKEFEDEWSRKVGAKIVFKNFAGCYSQVKLYIL